MKPRVLQLIGNLDSSGGSERQTAQLAQSLHESSRYQVFVACMDPNGDLGKELNRIGINEIPAFPFHSFFDHTMAIQLARFVNFLRKWKIEIIHTHDFYTNVFGITGARLAGTPVRVASRRETTGCRTPAQKFVERRAYQFSHAIVANAEAVRKQLIDEGVREDKITTIYNGLKRERVTPQYDRARTLELLNLPDGYYRYVTILANFLLPVKDHPTFLRAAQRVRRAFPEARFILAGEGRLTYEMQALAKELELETDAIFTGRCEHVAELLSISDVCVLSSMAEGFSNSILEYMGAGRPVVATNVGGAREAVIDGETGYLVQPGDSETMAARILDLLSNPERAQTMGQIGQRVVEQKFSCAAQLAHTEQLYEGLLSRVNGWAPVKATMSILKLFVS